MKKYFTLCLLLLSVLSSFGQAKKPVPAPKPKTTSTKSNLTKSTPIKRNFYVAPKYVITTNQKTTTESPANTERTVNDTETRPNNTDINPAKFVETYKKTTNQRPTKPVLNNNWSEERQSKFGLKIGFASVTLKDNNLNTGEKSPSNKSIGVQGGLCYKHMFTRTFGIQPEALITYTSHSADNDVEAYKLILVNLPILFRYLPAKKIALLAGPQIDYFASLKVNSSDGVYNVADDYKKIGISYALGVEFELNKTFSISARYSNSIMKFRTKLSTDNYSYSVSNSIVGLAIHTYFSKF